MKKYELDNNIIFDYVYHTRFDLEHSVFINCLINKIQENNLDMIIHYNPIYYDLYCFMKRKYCELYSTMINMNFKVIKKKYKTYGINPIIIHIIKLNNIKFLNWTVSHIKR